MKAVLFDFDGTLVDSFAGITASTNHVRASYGLPPLSESEIRVHVGLGLPHLIESLVPAAPVAEAIERYRAHHRTAMLTGTRLMPGVAETLRELARRGYRMAVCSNKRVEFTRQLVEHLGLAAYFAVILGPDDVGEKAKPDPTMLLEGLRRLSVSPADAIYVGDMAVDVRTAKAAGVPVSLVLGGAVGEEPAAAAHPDHVLGSFAELLELLPELPR